MTLVNLPNLLTIFRLVLAGVFFVILNFYRYPNGPEWALWTAFILFICAALTDALDGYLARKWHVETTFGRIMDPFCDKVLVLGAFIYLAGPRFVHPDLPTDGDFPFNMLPGNMITGVYPWMVALMLARELLVTGIRGELEGKGVQFAAKISGKLKATLQLTAVPTVLGFIGFGWICDGNLQMIYLRNGLVYATVIVTVISGIPYITSAAQGLRVKK